MSQAVKETSEQMDLFSELDKASFVIFGPRAYQKELGVTTRKVAIEEAREVKNEAEKKFGQWVDIRLYMRTKDFGAIQIDI